MASAGSAISSKPVRIDQQPQHQEHHDLGEPGGRLVQTADAGERTHRPVTDDQAREVGGEKSRTLELRRQRIKEHCRDDHGEQRMQARRQADAVEAARPARTRRRCRRRAPTVPGARRVPVAPAVSKPPERHHGDRRPASETARTGSFMPDSISRIEPTRLFSCSPPERSRKNTAAGSVDATMAPSRNPSAGLKCKRKHRDQRR